MEIGHVLFMDVVGYSKLLIDEQRALQEQLTAVVRNTECFRAADTAGRLVRLPVGDGMALVFFDSPEAPLRCAIDIHRALKNQPQLQLRMGIHSGPVHHVRDVNDRTNIAGAGINIAQRVMDCGDGGHILVSKHVAEDLSESAEWRSHLHSLGEFEVKHGARIDIFNFRDGTIGNAQTPSRLRAISRKALRTKLFVIAGAAALLAIATFAFYRQGAASIAVLPFENLSDDPQNAFFADGIQDDILTSLAKIKNLRVISRTSVMGYRGGKGAHNLREIGKALGVSNILEGSVRREGNRIKVTVQLLDAAQDRHLWGESYDRTLADSLGLQGELAAQIAHELSITLSPEEKARVEQAPTRNEDAYVFYLRADQIARNPDTLLEDYKKAEHLYAEAIELDPSFALAHAQLASTRAQIYHFYEPTDELGRSARESAETALGLQPNLAQAHFALGECIYWIDNDYERALAQFAEAARLAPNDADVVALIAAIKRRQGKWDDALATYQRSQKLDPQNPNVVRNLLFTNCAVRRWAEAAKWAKRLREMAPASLTGKIQSGYVDFWWKGDTRTLKDLIAQIPVETDPDGSVTTARWDVAMIERDFNGAEKVLEASPLNELSYTSAGGNPKSYLLGCTALAQGDRARAQKQFEAARPIYEAAVSEAPSSADRHANLGLCYAFLGRRDDAIREGRRAIELKPPEKDAVDSAIMNCYLALIYARLGDRDLAIPLIERLLKTPGAVDSVDYSITVNDLQRRWEWDLIREDARFRKLLE